MERIIINEVDNTSNVESLSSYDVAYVPGFSNGADDSSIDEKLYRNPTLITDKYQFTKIYGSECPRFATAQPYPAAFDEVAVKWSDNEGAYFNVKTDNFSTIADVVDSGFYIQQTEQISEIPANTHYYVVTSSEGPIDLSNIDNEDPADTIWQVNAFLQGYTVKPDTESTPVEGKTYYTESEGTFSPWTVDIATDANKYHVKDGDVYTQLTTESTGETLAGVYTYYKITWTSTSTYAEGVYARTENDNNCYVYTPTTDETLETYYTIGTSETEPITFPTDSTIIYEKGEAVPVFSSTTNPSTEGWYENDGADLYSLTADTYIIVDNEKVYYSHTAGVPAMFEQNDYDPGWRYAIALLSMGMPVYYEQMNKSADDITVENMYDGLIHRFTAIGTASVTNPDYSFDSMGDYAVKFITSGGYPTFEYNSNGLAEAMINLASMRKDSIALIDHTDNPTRNLDVYSEDSVITAVRNWTLSNSYDSYGAMFTPWFECTNPIVSPDMTGTSDENVKTMPGSFAYLTALAAQLLTTNPWLAVSGVTRGKVPYCSKLHTNQPLTNNIADTYQALPSDKLGSGTINVSINPITNIRNYGYCIWGNRTLRNNGEGTKALSFLNIRSVVADIKKRLYETSQRLLFDQNTDVLWINFKSLVTPLLEEMKTDYILNDYAITRFTIDPQTGAAVPAYKVLAVIRIQPINSVEVFDLTVVLENTDGFELIETAENEEV